MKNKTDLIHLYKVFVVNKNSFFKATLIFFILSVFYVFSKSDYYESNISLYAAGELDESSLLGQYGGIAENLGISMVPSSNYYIPDIIDSRSLKKEIVLKKWNTHKFENPVNLIEYWEIDNPGMIGTVISATKAIFKTDYFKNDKISQLDKAIEELNNLIYVDEKNSGLIVVSVSMEEPQLASEISNYISKYLVNFIKYQQKVFADKSKDFILERMELAEQDLSFSEDKLIEFRKKNPLVLDTPDLQLYRARLSRSVEVNQQVFITLREQLEIAKIESNKERLYINILDEAYPNPSKSGPQRLFLILVITFSGFLISLLSYVLLINFRLVKNEIESN